MDKKVADLTVKELQLLINHTMRRAFEEISEDILALSNPGYLASIKKPGRISKKAVPKPSTRSLMYKILITERAVRDIEKLDISIKKRIGEKLKLFSSNPLQYAKKLINPKIGV